MRRIIIELPKYNWTVRYYQDSAPSDSIEIYEALRQIGCTGKALDEAERHLSSKKKNKGLTYSNIKEGKSVVAVSETTSDEEFINTMSHEVHHVVSHICEKYDLDMYSEEMSYLTGYLCGKCYVG